MSEKQKNGLVLLVDLSAIYFRSWIGGGPETPVTNARQIALDTIRRIQSHFPPETACVICCDSRKNWRKKVDAEYKANREKQPDGFYVQLNLLKERLIADGYPLLEQEGFEADDVIASACKALATTDYHALICSPDKDLMQLIGPFVKQLRTHDMFLPPDENGNPGGLLIWDDAAVLEKSGVLPNRFADWLAICGDKADNVQGIPGVAGKGAAALLAEFGSLNALFTTVEACAPQGVSPFAGKPSLSKWEKSLSEFFLAPEKTKENIDKLARSRILVSLKNDIPIDVAKFFEKQQRPRTDDTISLPPEVRVEIDEPAQQTKALSTTGDPMDQFDNKLEPTGMRGLWWACQVAVGSRLYDKFGSPERCLMAVQRGRDFGLSLSASLELLQIIEGKVCPPSQVLQAMCQRHPDCLYFYVKDVSATSATAVTCRRRKDGKEGPEQTFTYTIEMAKQAGLIKPNGAWTKNPAPMCVARATSWLARWAYPDATTGAYSYEEMEGERA